MNLYLISQSSNNNYDTFDAAVVCAPDEETARDMNPHDGEPLDWAARAASGYPGSWVMERSQVKVQLLGVAKPFSTPGLVLASFCAG